MNKTLITPVLAAALAAAALPAQAQVDVGVSIGISQPGVYGRVDIGRFPQPVLVAPQPVVIGAPVVAAPQPVYMWVPPGHRRNWRRYCGRYHACGMPVYFVQDRWYREHVMPPRPPGPPPHAEGHGHGHGHGHDR